MITATERNCMAPSGHCSFRFTADASDLRIPPGPFPVSIETTLGNGQAFRLTDYDTKGALYRQQFGCIDLFVYND